MAVNKTGFTDPCREVDRISVIILSFYKSASVYSK